LVETNIYDPQSRAVHLELDDGWLGHAAIAAAQHERDLALRGELLANPEAFLEQRGWIGLLNADRAKLPTVSPTLSTDAVPLEDTAINTGVTVSQSGSDWHTRTVATSGRTRLTTEIDLVARERATNSHYMLEEILVGIAKAQNFSPKRNANIDIYFETPSGTVLVEIKSCTDSNFHAQFRRGISQLFEYHFLYRELLGPKTTMLLLMEAAPPAEKSWLIAYADYLGVILAWKDPNTKAIITTGSLPESLSKIVIAKS